jgi:hypothetical protein
MAATRGSWTRWKICDSKTVEIFLNNDFLIAIRQVGYKL